MKFLFYWCVVLGAILLPINEFVRDLAKANICLKVAHFLYMHVLIH